MIVAQGTAGLALVICFGLLRTRQVTAATLLLIAQAAAIAITAIVLRRPAMALAPALLSAAVWSVRHRSAALGLLAPPIGGPKLGILAGVVLAALCQSQGAFAVPMSIVLLGILLAATRPHALMQLIALVVAQNGIVLAACHVPASPGLALAGLALPVPLAAALIAGYPRPGARVMRHPMARWAGWARVLLATAILVASITVPLDPMAALFAPLFAVEGLLRAWAERRRTAAAPFGHLAATLRLACTTLAVATPDPLLGWLAILGAMVTALLPVLERCWQNVTLGLCAAGIALFGLQALAGGSPGLGYPCLFLGYTVIAAVVPALAAPLVVLVLRQVHGDAWTPAAAWLACGVSSAGMLACAVLLRCRIGRHRLTLLHLSQAAVAVLAIGTNQPDGRYAAAILLILLTLTSAASRMGQGPAAVMATAGLGGIPPFGVFPALLLVVLALCGNAPWLLLPLGAALALSAPASLPVRSSAFRDHRAMLSAAWLPLALAVIVGFFTPDSLARWLRLLAAGPS